MVVNRGSGITINNPGRYTKASNVSIDNTDTIFISKDLQDFINEINPYFDSFLKRSIVSVQAHNSLITSLTTNYDKLTFFDTIKANYGPMFEVDTLNQELKMLEDCEIKLYGEISVEFGNTKEFNIAVAINGVEQGPGKYAIGFGSGKPTNLSSSTVLSCSAGDLLTVRAKSLSGDGDINIVASSIQLEYIDII